MALQPLDHLPTPAWPVALQQHPLFAKALRHLGIEHRVIGWSNRVSDGAVLLMRRRFGPFGIDVASRPHLPPGVASELARMTRRWGTGLAITPETATPAMGALPVATPAHVAEWDLTHTSQVRRKGLSGPWRTALHKAEGSDVKVMHLTPDRSDLLETLARDARQQRRKGFRALPSHFTLAMGTVEPTALVLFQAQCADRVVAEALVVKHGAAASYHVGWTSPEGRKLQAMNLVLWTAANALADRGIERFDLGLLATDRAPGLARFKIGTGAQVRTLGATLFFGPCTGFLSRYAASSGPAAKAPRRSA
ncbi:MAG: GNAT family N-acetyltransferase [Pseudomonadota bacterium]